MNYHYSKSERILFTGAHGFLGHHAQDGFKDVDCEKILVTRRDYDLREKDQVRKMLRDIKPTMVVHLAAVSGGIVSNKKYPVLYYYDNILINTYMIDEAHKAGVKKFLAFMGGCSYPSDAKSPIGEDQMWRGFPQKESAGYSTAKMMQLVQAFAYRRQHGFKVNVIVPGNLYGEWDNFNQEQSHVVPAFIRRYVEAKEQNQPEVAMLGTGKPQRDFVYAGDVGKLIPYFLFEYDSEAPVNISSGTTTSIKDLAEAVKEATGYAGNIRWDSSSPDGQMVKIFDVAKLRSLGLGCDTPLREGLKKTIDWFVKNKDKARL
jgi:GDP-L-fucose synthase